MSVASLLPAGVTSADQSAFELDLAGTTLNRSLADLCADCVIFDGLLVPKPAFVATFSSDMALPADVLTAALASGGAAIGVTNNFGFDPIRPSAANRGSLRVVITSGAHTLANVIVDGNDESFAPGTTLSLPLDFTPGTLAGTVSIEVTLDSPAGDFTTIDTSQAFGVEVAPAPLRVSQVQVAVQNKTVNVSQVTLDLEEIDQNLVDRVHGGAFLLEITNPFAVSGNLTLSVGQPGQQVTKALPIAPGTTSPRVVFTAGELRMLLGQSGVVLGASGSVSGAGVVTITPAQVLVLKSRIELTVGPKEE